MSQQWYKCPHCSKFNNIGNEPEWYGEIMLTCEYCGKQWQQEYVKLEND